MTWLHWAGQWSFDPSVWVGCALLLPAYLFLPGRRPDRRMVSWAAGVLLLFVALESAIDQVGDNYLFSVHMAQHLLLAMVAPPLLVFGLPWQTLRTWWRSPIGRALGRALSPGPAGVAYVAILVGWHWPPIFEYALTDPLAHVAQHASFIAAGLLFWGAVRVQRSPAKRSRRRRPGFTYLMVCGAVPGLVVGLTLALLTTPAYSFYLHRSPLLGISALGDQRLGGWLMFIFDAVLMLGAAVVDLRHPAPDEQPTLTREHGVT